MPIRNVLDETKYLSMLGKGIEEPTYMVRCQITQLGESCKARVVPNCKVPYARGPELTLSI